jgi:hypothetical protein
MNVTPKIELEEMDTRLIMSYVHNLGREISKNIPTQDGEISPEEFTKMYANYVKDAVQDLVNVAFRKGIEWQKKNA